MQAPRNDKRKTSKFMDMKLLIAVMALAVTIGLWNLLSNNAVEAEKLAPTAEVTVTAQPPAGVAQDLAPMPTLVSVITIDPSKANFVAPAEPAAQQASTRVQPAAGPLRSVAVPNQTIVQQKAIIVQSAAAAPAGGGGGGGGGGGSKPSTSTHSSKPK